MAISWRSFDFFDVSAVALTDDVRQLFESNRIASVCSGSGSIYLGGDDGSISILNRNWKIVGKFQAHDAGRVTHMRQVEGTSVLITIAEDLTSEPVLKAWALAKSDKKINGPTCLSTLSINNGRRQFPVSAFTSTDDLTQIAIGFGNGAVTVIRGDLIHDLGSKQRIVYESEEPVTGVQLVTDEKLTTLFVSTTSRVIKLGLSRKGQGLPPKTVEDSGCAVGCMTLDPGTGDVVVARDDAIYTYSLGGRGPPRAYESQKNMISLFKNYIALAGPSSAGSARDPDSIRRRFGSDANDALLNASSFVLLEPELRVVAHTQTLISPLRFVSQIGNDFFAITQEGKQRLEQLYHRNLYPLAIELAQNAGLDNPSQSHIYRRYGDYLYQKGDFDGAMVQYIRAIDITEPSQVIRKFLDTQRIHNLIQYLEQLHESRKATADHTTLLLNCYAKLKDVDKLERFIKSPGELNFDLDTAITMCRQSGYYEQAAYLAERHSESELVVDILIEDSQKFAEALAFIWAQEPEIYARVLIEHCPADTTSLFVEYYTGRYKPRHVAHAPQDGESPSAGGLAAGAASAVQNLSHLFALPYVNTSSTASPGTSADVNPVITSRPSADEGGDPVMPAYKPPPPRTAFSSFIDHPDEFLLFLESLLDQGDYNESDRKDLHTTLLELYLYKSREEKEQHRKEDWESKAKELIQREDVAMESSNVLLLSHLSKFREGTVLVKEQAGMLMDIFRSYASAKDTQGALKALRKYGPEEPRLYPAALAYLTSDQRVLDEAGPDELAAVLNKIDRDRLMPPLQVIQTITRQASGGGAATMGMLKPYLQETISRERREINSNRQRINGMRADTEKRRLELQELATKPTVFQATRCAECGQTLDLPAVHFLCKHSFHQRCLRAGGVEAELECPKCAGENEVIRKMRERQKESAKRQDLFKADLESSEDRFATIAQWFARGVMDPDQEPEP